MSCGVGRRLGSDPALLWLWPRWAAVTPIRPLAWESSYAMSVALKSKKKKQKQNKKNLGASGQVWSVSLGYRSLIEEQSSQTRSGFWLIVLSFLFFFSLGPSCGIWRFPGKESNWSCSHQPTPETQHQIWATSATYTTAHGSAGSLTHWARPGIKPSTSWFLH